MIQRSMKQKMVAGEPCHANDPEIIADQLAAGGAGRWIDHPRDAAAGTTVVGNPARVR